MSDAFGISLEDVTSLLHRNSVGGERVHIDPETVEQDLARLLLGLMEMLRQVMELRAIERFENGHLTEQQEEKLGLTLMRAETAIQDMAAKFGLKPEDLSLDLGPLGRTI